MIGGRLPAALQPVCVPPVTIDGAATSAATCGSTSASLLPRQLSLGVVLTKLHRAAFAFPTAADNPLNHLCSNQAFRRIHTPTTVKRFRHAGQQKGRRAQAQP